MTTDRSTRLLLGLIALGLFLNAAVALVPRVEAAGEGPVQRVQIVNWPRGEGATPVPVYVMNGRLPDEVRPQIPVLVVNQRYN